MRLKNLIIFSIVICVFHIQAQQRIVNFKNDTGLADKDITFQFKQVLAQVNKPFSSIMDLSQIDLKIHNVVSIITKPGTMYAAESTNVSLESLEPGKTYSITAKQQRKQIDSGPGWIPVYVPTINLK